MLRLTGIKVRVSMLLALVESLGSLVFRVLGVSLIAGLIYAAVTNT